MEETKNPMPDEEVTEEVMDEAEVETEAEDEEVLTKEDKKEAKKKAKADKKSDALKEKIAELEEKIAYIIRNDPYRYKDILNNPIVIEEKKDELRKDIKKHKKYKKELDDVLNEMLGKEAKTLKWTIH